MTAPRRVSLLVAVCTNRNARAIAESVGALRAQLGPQQLLLVTSGLGAAAVREHRSSFRGPVVTEPRPGLSRARNRALAWAGARQAEVLAFIDDDAIVERGWGSALQARWDEAPGDVACIGGPIRPRYELQPPPWLSDAIAHTLTLLDRGPRTLELDPAHAAVYGANISFRVEALLQIGGFDPRLGHLGGRAFFAEEDQAERDLARLGYRIRYVPDASVCHVIGADRLLRRSFIKRRFAYGLALGLRHGRPRATAASQLLSSAAGALAATSTGNGALAMERAVRAAENAGVLLAPVAVPRGAARR